MGEMSTDKISFCFVYNGIVYVSTQRMNLILYYGLCLLSHILGFTFLFYYCKLTERKYILTEISDLYQIESLFKIYLIFSVHVKITHDMLLGGESLI